MTYKSKTIKEGNQISGFQLIELALAHPESLNKSMKDLMIKIPNKIPSKVRFVPVYFRIKDYINGKV